MKSTIFFTVASLYSEENDVLWLCLQISLFLICFILLLVYIYVFNKNRNNDRKEHLFPIINHIFKVISIGSIIILVLLVGSYLLNWQLVENQKDPYALIHDPVVSPVKTIFFASIIVINAIFTFFFMVMDQVFHFIIFTLAFQLIIVYLFPSAELCSLRVIKNLAKHFYWIFALLNAFIWFYTYYRPSEFDSGKKVSKVSNFFYIICFIIFLSIILHASVIYLQKKNHQTYNLQNSLQKYIFWQTILAGAIKLIILISTIFLDHEGDEGDAQFLVFIDCQFITLFMVQICYLGCNRHQLTDIKPKIFIRVILGTQNPYVQPQSIVPMQQRL